VDKLHPASSAGLRCLLAKGSLGLRLQLRKAPKPLRGRRLRKALRLLLLLHVHLGLHVPELAVRADAALGGLAVIEAQGAAPAAIALAAEKPRLEAIKDMPIKEEEQIITRPMWRQIIGTTLYSSVVMFLMFWFNEDIWGITYQMNDPWMDGVDPSNKTKAFTMLFNIFVYMHLFNMINCR
jgi:hypothetical protein